ncbi:CGNR zinc finger domain-containing protein [Salinarimonas chemoclinalis]|uniref:CGNR zinc finger domain-containing protein n=1 Tax=Salinarimonas chemoclinalis TaxID=3241599 RepID=UPI0035575E42
MTERSEVDPRFESGALVLDFVNSTTGRSRGRSRWEDSLTDAFATLGWLRQRDAFDEVRFRALMRIAASDQAASDAFMEDVRLLRGALERIFHAAIVGTVPEEADLALLAARGPTARPAPARLVWGPQGLARAEPETRELALADALAPIVASAEALLTADRLMRVKTCGSSTCEWLFLDTSKNNSRRWCRMDVCGNREKGRRRLQRERAA